jgi:hypothetical protein
VQPAGILVEQLQLPDGGLQPELDILGGQQGDLEVIRLGCRPAPHPAHVLLAAQVADAVPQVEQRPHLLGLHLLQQGGEGRHGQGSPARILSCTGS